MHFHEHKTHVGADQSRGQGQARTTELPLSGGFACPRGSTTGRLTGPSCALALLGVHDQPHVSTAVVSKALARSAGERPHAAARLVLRWNHAKTNRVRLLCQRARPNRPGAGSDQCPRAHGGGHHGMRHLAAKFPHSDPCSRLLGTTCHSDSSTEPNPISCEVPELNGPVVGFHHWGRHLGAQSTSWHGGHVLA